MSYVQFQLQHLEILLLLLIPTSFTIGVLGNVPKDDDPANVVFVVSIG
jgi:hypothetical protein